MAKGVFIQVSGMDTVAEINGLLRSLGSKVKGAYLKADDRKGGVTNGDIIQFLAGRKRDGTQNPAHKGPIRDARPTKKDADDAAKEYKTKVMEELRKINRKPKNPRTRNKVALAMAGKLGEMKASQADAKGFRAAVKKVQGVMVQRVDSGSYPPPTNDQYARWRWNEYGVPFEVALKASGDLLRNLKRGPILLSKV